MLPTPDHDTGEQPTRVGSGVGEEEEQEEEEEEEEEEAMFTRESITYEDLDHVNVMVDIDGGGGGRGWRKSRTRKPEGSSILPFQV